MHIPLSSVWLLFNHTPLKMYSTREKKPAVFRRYWIQLGWCQRLRIQKKYLMHSIRSGKTIIIDSRGVCVCLKIKAIIICLIFYWIELFKKINTCTCCTWQYTKHARHSFKRAVILYFNNNSTALCRKLSAITIQYLAILVVRRTRCHTHAFKVNWIANGALTSSDFQYSSSWFE